MARCTTACPPTLYRPGDGGGYLAFLGRISPEKRLDRAIDVAVETGIPLKIAAKVDPVNLAYYEQEIKPRLAHPLVEYVGEINDVEKQAFLGNAIALLRDGEEAYPAMLSAIESARTSVGLESYIFRDDAAGGEFIAALIRAHERGVAVRPQVVGDREGVRQELVERRRRIARDVRQAGSALLPPADREVVFQAGVVASCEEVFRHAAMQVQEHRGAVIAS